MSNESMLDFIAGVRSAMDRGLPVTAEDVLHGIEYAIEAQREKSPVLYAKFGVPHVEDRCRAFLRTIDIAARYEADRRFGQPHHGHGIEIMWAEPPK